MYRRAIIVRSTYYRLHDRRSSVIGFQRVTADATHYVDLRSEHWQIEPIEYAERIRLAEALPGFMYLKDPEKSD